MIFLKNTSAFDPEIASQLGGLQTTMWVYKFQKNLSEKDLSIMSEKIKSYHEK